MFSITRFLVTAFLCLCGIVPALAQTPRVYLKFDGNLTDSSTAGLVTSVAASAGFTPTYAADRFNVASKAVVFTGGQSLQLVASTLPGNSNQALGLRNAGGTNTSFTLAAWVYFTSLGSGQGYSTIFGNTLTNPAVTTEAGTLHAGLNTGSDKAHFGFNNSNDVTGATAPMVVNQWYHIAFVYNATGTTQRIYVNGVPEVTRFTVTNTLRVADLFLGNWGTATDAANDLKGRLDEVAVFNSALSADQIQALFNGVDANSLAAAGTYSGPKLPGIFGTPGNWGVREIKAYPGIAYGTLVNADRIIRAYATTPGGTVAEYQTSVINFLDDEGPGTGGYFANEGDLGTNTAAADDNVLMIAKCAVRIPAGQGGDYTFGFRGDDGSRLRVLGKQFASSTRIATGNVADPAHAGDGFVHPNGSGDSNTLAVVNLTPGDYNLEFVWWEGGGGCSCEVFAAKGAKTVVDAAFQLIGNTAAGGLEIVRDPDTVPVLTVNGASTLFVHSGAPANFTLAWSVANPTTTLSIDGVGVGQSGSQLRVSPAVTTTYTITATTGTAVVTTSATVYVNAPPAVTFTANDTTVTSGAAVTLSWVADGATSLTLQPGNINVTGTTSRVVNPTVDTTYTLVATNPAGTTQPTVFVDVGAAPTITSFTVADANPLYGAETSLSWNVSAATALSINQNVGTVSGATGTVAIFPLLTTTYTLSATNDYGTATANATVTLPVAVGVTAAGFTARRVSSTVPFPFTPPGPLQSYLQSALAVLGGQNAGTTTTTGGYTTVNFSDGADGDFTTGNVAFPGGTGDNFAVEITATLVVNSPGEYSFVVNCDDGCRLRIDGQDVIVDDGTHAPGGNSGRITLTNPTAQLQLVYYDATGGAEVELAWIRPNLSWQLLTTTTPVAPIVRGSVLISEFMADNSGTLLDEDGASSDWIELWNSTAGTVSFAGYYLTDDALVPNKWALPAWTLGPDKYAVVFASLKNRTPAQAVAGQDNPGTLAQPHLHTNFKLSKTGGYLALMQDNGGGGYSTISVFSAYPAQREDVSYGTSDAEGYLGFMEFATPGVTNDTTVSGFVADTVFTDSGTGLPRLRGRYSAPFNLAITTATSGATIRYTTDGSAPTVSRGAVYTGPIAIGGTTVVRAAAFKTGWKPSNVDTQSYLFVDDIVNQTTATATALGFPLGAINGQIFRYGMNVANVTAGGGTLQALKDALTAAPSVCLSTDISNLVDVSAGIYVNPGKHGLFWERPVSMEYINAAGTSEFQIDAGARIRGGFSRSTGNPKHAFHLYFRGLYDGDLKYRLFGTEGASEFSQIDMRCEQNYSWGFQNNSNNALVREEWARVTQRDMGQPYARNGYFHLYINGTYWGVYNFEERAEAAYAATYFGAVQENVDVVKSAGSSNSYSTEMTDGNFAAWQSLYTQLVALKNDLTTEASRTARYMQLRGLNPGGTPNPAYPVLLDVDNLADYMLTVFYDGSFDSPVISSGSNNWFGVRDRAGTRGFAFFSHDQEHGMDTSTGAYNRVGPWGASGNNNWGQAMYNLRESTANGYYYKSNPHYLHEFLCYSAEYRQRFADRVHKHFFNGGALTTASATGRVNALAALVDPIIHAEAARWGSATLQRNTWVTAKNNVLAFMNNGIVGTPPAGQTAWTSPYPGARNGLVIAQLQGYTDSGAKPLYPTLAAPTISGQFGGIVPIGHPVSITNPNGTGAIQYTLNGPDPRDIGGAVSGSAITAASPIPLSLNSTLTLRARVYDSGTLTWSPLVEAEYIVGTAASAANLVISEIHYNPPGSGNLTQFVELMNISAGTIDLTNVRFLLGIQFTFPDATLLAPGARLVIVRDQAAFTAAYPAVPLAQIAGVFTGSLDTGGEQLQLVGATGAIIRDFTYDNNPPWPETPDGGGPSLVLIKPETNPDHSLAANWRASATAAGAPGFADGLSFAAWSGGFSLAGGLNGDDDHDGSSNLAEYYLGTSPLDAAAVARPVQAVQAIDVAGIASNYLTLTFTRTLGRDDASASVQSSADLTGAWSAAILVGTPTDNGNGTETLTYRYPAPVPAPPVNGTRQFLRLRITQP